MKKLGEKQKAVLRRIQKRMDELGVTQAELGKALHMEQYQVSKLLHGSPTLTIDMLFLIAKKLDTTLDYLLLLRDENLRELTQDDRQLLLSFDASDEATKAVIKRLLCMK